MYFWRKMTKEQQEEVLKTRKLRQLPWHNPPHMQNNKEKFHITASCFEHKKVIGTSKERLRDFEDSLLALQNKNTEEVYAWCILLNHYHIMVKSYDVLSLLKEIGQLHCRKSYQWNGEDNTRGRQVWFNVLEHGIKSERHFWATMNYIHNNPLKHEYVKKWQDWEYSSANKFLEEIGTENAKIIWNEYDISEMGSWDE